MKKLSVACFFVLCLLFLKPIITEASTATVISVPTVNAYQENVTLGKVKISEETSGALVNGQEFYITLPSGITFNQNTVIQATYYDSINLQYYNYSPEFIQTELMYNNSSMKIVLSSLNNNVKNDIWINTVANIGNYSGEILLSIDGRSSGVSDSLLVIGHSAIENKTFKFVEGNGTFYVNDEQIVFDVPPVNVNNTLFVPTRAILKSLCASAIWNNNTQEITIEKTNAILKMQINSTTAYFNDMPFQLVSSPIINNGRTLIPAKQVIEKFGYNVVEIFAGEPGTPKYLVNIVPDDIYTIGETNDGIKTMTVKNGISGFKYFTIYVQSVNEHIGDEVVIFALWRNGQLSTINATKADFDHGVTTAKAGFNVSSGDIIKVYIVDDLTNSQQTNPVILQ